MERSMNFASAVTATQPNRASPHKLTVRFYGGQFTESHTGNIPLPWFHSGHTAAVRDALPLQTASIQQDLSAAITAAQPYNIAIFSFLCGSFYGQSANAAARFNR